jgi:hypothetical protein
MTILKVFFVVLSLSVTALAEEAVVPGLTAVDRGPCLMLPELKASSAASAGADYVADGDRDCIGGQSQCHIGLSVDIKYHYSIVIRTDYYTAQGKLVTSKESKMMQLIEESEEGVQSGRWREISWEAGLTPLDQAAKDSLEIVYNKAADQVLVDIRQKISEAPDVCSGSFYK